MKTVQFVNGYLKGNARVTIAETNGDIIYNGEVKSLNPTLIKKTNIESISGIGSDSDIIINVTRNGQ